MSLQSLPELATLQDTSFLQLDVDGVRVEIAYTATSQEVQRILQCAFGQQDVVGFDSEGHDPDGKVKVVQLAWSAQTSGTVYVVVWSIRPTDAYLPVAFKAVLEDANIRIAGVDIEVDMQKFYATLAAADNIRRCVELSCLSHSVHHEHEEPFESKIALTTLYFTECGSELPVDKKSDVRKGYWGGRLNAEQVRYAALDAFASLQVALRLLARGTADPQTCYTFNAVQGIAVDNNHVKWVRQNDAYDLADQKHRKGWHCTICTALANLKKIEPAARRKNNKGWKHQQMMQHLSTCKINNREAYEGTSEFKERKELCYFEELDTA